MPVGDDRHVGVAETVGLGAPVDGRRRRWLGAGDADGDGDAGGELGVELVELGALDGTDDQVAG